MRVAWRRTILLAIAAAAVGGVGALACVGSDSEPVAPAPDAARSGDDDDVIAERDSGADVLAPELGCVIGTETFDFCDSFDGPGSSFVPPWDSPNVTDAGHLQRVDGGVIAVLDRETTDGSTFSSAASTLKYFGGDIGTFVLERRVRVTPTDESATNENDPGITISQVVFAEARGGGGGQFDFYQTWRLPTHDAGTFEGGIFRQAFAGVALTLGGGDLSDSWAKLPRVGQWYLVRDIYEIYDSRVALTVVVDGTKQVHTERPMAFPRMQSAVLFLGPGTHLGPGAPAHAGWVVEMDDVRVAFKPRR